MVEIDGGVRVVEWIVMVVERMVEWVVERMVEWGG